MAVTLTVNTDHTASLSSRYLARQGEVGVLMTVTVPTAVYALGTYAYIDFTDADGVASYLGDYDASSGTFVVSVGAADNILAKDGIVKIQFVLRDNLISESYTAVWKSQIVEAIVERSVNADTYAIPAAMPSDDPPDTYEASRVSIEDVGTHYASNNVEDALQEAAVDIADNTADIADIRAGGNSAPFVAMPYVGTAPIVESGSNTNGYYVKYADGTMVCWHTTQNNLAIQTAMLGGYRSSGQTWTFPAEFNVTPVCIASGEPTDSFSYNCNGKSTTYASYAYTAISSQLVAARVVNLLAIGTWS